jgi:hypothetical protein
LPVVQKEIAGRLESGTQTGKDEEDESSGEPKETALSREMMPADGRNPAQRTGSSARPRLQPTAAYLSPTGVAKNIFFWREIAISWRSITRPARIRLAKASPPCQMRPNVRAEAPPTHDNPLRCLGCGGPLQNRDGKFALKYFRKSGSNSINGRKPRLR